MLKERVADTGHFIGNVFRKAGHNAIHDAKKGAKMTMTAEKMTNPYSFRHKGAGVSIAYAVACGLTSYALPIALAITIPVVGAVTTVGVSAAHAVATPFIETGKVIGHAINPDYDAANQKELHDTTNWTCCQNSGPWVKPCAECKECQNDGAFHIDESDRMEDHKHHHHHSLPHIHLHRHRPHSDPGEYSI